MTQTQPYILEETDDFAVVFKPAKMHSAPLKKKDGGTSGTLFDWYTAQSSSFTELMHRLDFETHGLALFAKNKKSYEFFNALQNGGEFIKEYSAVCINDICINAASTTSCSSVPGFPPPPVFAGNEASSEKPLVIESYFRPYGPGRKLVRPVTDDGKKYREIAKDKGGSYRTEIIDVKRNVFTVRIRRGFRHQIRCHLSWIGCPILNDPLYPLPANRADNLVLRAHALFFIDPASGKQRVCRIDSHLVSCNTH